MSNKGNIYMHVIEEEKANLLAKMRVSSVPRVNEEIRDGGEGNERYYKITRVVWVYDEPDHPYERVNIGVVPIPPGE